MNARLMNWNQAIDALTKSPESDPRVPSPLYLLGRSFRISFGRWEGPAVSKRSATFKDSYGTWTGASYQLLFLAVSVGRHLRRPRQEVAGEDTCRTC